MKDLFSSARSLLTACAAASLVVCSACDAPSDPADLYDPADGETAAELDPDDPAALDVDERYDVPEGTPLAWVDFGGGPTKVAYEVENGQAIWQGDIVLGDAEEVARASDDYEANPDDVGHRSAVAHMSAWPNGVIPYQIDVSGPTRTRVETAIEDWNSQTLINLVPRDPSNPLARYVRFTHDGSPGCRSALGMQPGWGAQNITIDLSCSTGSIRHEIGHAVGLFHEHGRADRDLRVRVNWDNIHWWKHNNYYTYLVSGVTGIDFGLYDFNSLMHYGSYATSAHAIDPTLPVMVRAGCDPDSTSSDCTFFARRLLTQWDKAGVTRQVTGAPPTFKLRNESTGRCLRPQGAGRTPGTRVTQSDCSNFASRRWYTWQPPGASGQVLVNDLARHCLGVDDNDNMVLTECTADSDHLFTIGATSIGRGDRIIRGGTRCVRASTSGTNAFLSARCNNTPTRRWFRDWI